jgi:hypothetical protein
MVEALAYLVSRVLEGRGIDSSAAKVFVIHQRSSNSHPS